MGRFSEAQQGERLKPVTNVTGHDVPSRGWRAEKSQDKAMESFAMLRRTSQLAIPQC
jgi:hypothetical protein